MPAQILVLLTWTTRLRAPLVGSEANALLARLLPAIARRHGADTIALGIVPDHVHHLLRLPLQIDIPRLVQGLKGASARITNREGKGGKERLRWANGYDLRSIGLKELHRAIAYVERQAEHHGVRRDGWLFPG